MGVAFSAQSHGDLIAVAGADGAVRVYIVDVEALLHLAESRVTRLLTLAESQKFLHLQQGPAPDL